MKNLQYIFASLSLIFLSHSVNASPYQNELEDHGRYFFTMYGFQGAGPLNLPRYTHSWAVLISTSDPNSPWGESSSFALSWDAADGHIGIGQGPERGELYTLAGSIEIANSLPVATVVRRTPIIEIDRNLYHAFVRQYRKLEAGIQSGNIRYVMIDNIQQRHFAFQGLPGGVLNCQHAASDVVVGWGGQFFDLQMLRGIGASNAIFSWIADARRIDRPGIIWDEQLSHLLDF